MDDESESEQGDGAVQQQQAPQSSMAQETRSFLELENLNEIPLWLAPCHLIAAIFLCMQTFILFVLSSQLETKWFVYTNYPGEENIRGNEYGRPISKEVGAYTVTWLSGVSLLLSAVDHICMTIPSIRRIYEYKIQRNESPFRWCEYALSAPVIRVMIAQIAGVTDVHLLVCIFFLAQSTILFAVAHEKINAKARADGYSQILTIWFCSFIPHLVTWGVIFSYFSAGISRGDPPAFVTTVVFSLFFLEATFPAVFVLQWSKFGVFNDYLVGEFWFIILSFTSKTFLAWVAYGAGAL